MRRLALSTLLVGFGLVYLPTAHAVPVLELSCRIDNSILSSVPRTIQLRDGMIETIDCQTHRTCKNSIYEITMNYNSHYEKVTVSVSDTATKKSLSTESVLAPNLSGDRLKDATLIVGYGVTVTPKSDIPKLDRAGKFLQINCERTN